MGLLLGRCFNLRFGLNRHQYSHQKPCLGLHSLSGVPVDAVQSKLENKADNIPRPVGAAGMALLVMKIKLYSERRAWNKALLVKYTDVRKLYITLDGWYLDGYLHALSNTKNSVLRTLLWLAYLKGVSRLYT